jgi:succinate dehydrogenase / fumarate reductase flavoprotein subunit
MKTLRDEIRNLGIEVLEFSPVCELLTDGNGMCTGAVLYNLETGEYAAVRSKTTIIATGGSGRLHVQGFPTTNHYGATGDGIVLGYRAGAKLIYLDSVQYHPTGAVFPEQILGLLVTEKMRGLGAHLLNKNGERFVYELETRDVVSAAIIRECHIGNGVEISPERFGVWLDTPMIEIVNGPGTIEKNVPAMVRQYKRFDIDIRKEPILVYPTQHYQNGGILIDEYGRTSVRNLYSIGEMGGGVHGRNRLMGNSLLALFVYGRVAGKHAALRSKEVGFGKITLRHLDEYEKKLKRLHVPTHRRSPMLLPDYVGKA